MKNNRIVVVLIVTLLIVVLAVGVFQVASANQSQAPLAAGAAEFAFLNVAQGDSALLRDSTGFTVLIDGGKPDQANTILAYLRANGVDNIDVMVASHADTDHIGGLTGVLQATDIPVLSVVYNGYPGTTQNWENFVNAVQAEGLSLTPVSDGQTLTWGTMTATVFSPTAGLVDPDTNDASIGLRVVHGTVRLVFTGDADSVVEGQILARGENINADIFKVSHHGSHLCNSAAFLQAISPKDAVISVGPNSYGHPSPETLGRLENVGATIHRTDEDGDVIFISNGTSYALKGSSTVFLPLVTRSSSGDDPQPTPVPTVNVKITTVYFKTPEYVEFTNAGNAAVALQGWTLSDAASKTFTFPAFMFQPGQTCRVYTTGTGDPQFCNFGYDSGSSIWNDAGDTATLRDAKGKIQAEYRYP